MTDTHESAAVNDVAAAVRGWLARDEQKLEDARIVAALDKLADDALTGADDSSHAGVRRTAADQLRMLATRLRNDP